MLQLKIISTENRADVTYLEEVGHALKKKGILGVQNDEKE